MHTPFLLFALGLLCVVWGEQPAKKDLPPIAYQPFYLDWTELVALSGYRVEDLVLYRLNGYTTSSQIDSLEDPYRLPLAFDLVFDLFSESHDTMVTFDKIQSYLRALRINFATPLELKHVWKLLNGFLELDYVISIDSERRALRLLTDRLMDLRTMDVTDRTEEYQDALFLRFYTGFESISAWLSDFASINSEQFCLLEGREQEDYLDTAFASVLATTLSHVEDPITLEEHIDKHLVAPVLAHYKQYSLSPYLLTRWCSDIAYNATLYRYQVIGNTSITFPGSQSVDGLYTTRLVLSQANWSYFEDLQLVKRYLDLNQNFFIHPQTSCQVEMRQMMM
ncbi:hypothetical protein EON65_16965 [archaeon]|nr:MAG: hypothetical protein EON65_16965 [archaeon]